MRRHAAKEILLAATQHIAAQNQNFAVSRKMAPYSYLEVHDASFIAYAAFHLCSLMRSRTLRSSRLRWDWDQLVYFTISCTTGTHSPWLVGCQHLSLYDP